VAYGGRRHGASGAAAPVTPQLEPEPPVQQLYRVRGGCRLVVLVAVAAARGPASPAAHHLEPPRARAPVPRREHGHRAQSREQVGPALLTVGGRPARRLSFPALSPPVAVPVVIVIVVIIVVVVVVVVTVTGVREIGRNRRQPEFRSGCNRTLSFSFT